MSKHIFFISSYPKSGNTLMRLIITSLFFTQDGKVDFENLKYIGQLENKIFLEFIKKVNEKDFLGLNNLSTLYKYHVKIKEKSNLNFKEDFTFFKSHNIMNSFNGHEYVNENQIRGIIYLVRDPRDIVLSWKNFDKTSTSNSVDLITNENSSITWNDHIHSTLPAKIKPKVLISSWKNHVNSIMIKKHTMPVLIIKFEDLITNKEIILEKIINFFENNFKIKILNNKEKIKNILETSNFDKLKEAENISHFKESNDSKFFNKGKVGNWKNNLDNHYLEKIEKDFIKEMKIFNYK